MPSCSPWSMSCAPTSHPHAAHRQTKLTAALKDSLGGNCRTVMVANLWPEAAHLEECASTLRFASRVSGAAASRR